MSRPELFTDLAGSPWTLVDGTSGGRFCDASQVNDSIDKDKDGPAYKKVAEKSWGRFPAPDDVVAAVRAASPQSR